MNKQIWLLLWAGCPLFGFESEELVAIKKRAPSPPPPPPKIEPVNISPSLEAKGAYFFFSDSGMRNVYPHGGFEFQISGTYPVWKQLAIYGAISYLTIGGHSLEGNQRTTLWQVPIDFGLRPTLAIHKKVQYYFTLGPRVFFLRQHNSSSYVDRHVDRNGLGFFANTGFNFFPYPHFLIDLFGQYSYEHVHFRSSRPNAYGESRQVGGFSFGLGLGYAY